MADFTGGNVGSRVERNKTCAEFGNETMSCENLNNNSDTASRVEHENSACLFNSNDHTLALQKVKLDVGESERNDASTEEESAIVGNDRVEDNSPIHEASVQESVIVGNDGVEGNSPIHDAATGEESAIVGNDRLEDENEIITNGAAENSEVHSGNGSVPFQNGDLNLGDKEISVKDEILDEETGNLDIENNNKEVKDVCDAGNEVEESGMETVEHQSVETDKVETDDSNGRSLKRKEDETLADEAEGAELEQNMDEKIELKPEQEEKAKSELASENGEIVAKTDSDKLDHISTDSDSVMNNTSASGEAEYPKPVQETPIKTRSWRDIAVDGMEFIPDKVEFRSRNPVARRSVPKVVKSVVRSGDLLNSKIESNVFVTKRINEALSDESVGFTSSAKGSTSEVKLEQVAEQDCKLESEAEKSNDIHEVADLFPKSKGLDIGQENISISTIDDTDKEEQVKGNRWKKMKGKKARKEEELRKEAEEEKRREEEEEAKKERLRKEEEAAELRKILIDEEMEKMRMAEERKKRKKAEKAQKRAEYKAQKEAEEKEKKKAKKQKKKSGTSDASSVTSEKSATSPEKNSPDASCHDPETSRSAALKRPVVASSKKKVKVNVPKDPLPLTLRNRSKRKWMKGVMWSVLLVSSVLMLFIAGNYVSPESLFKGFTF